MSFKKTLEVTCLAALVGSLAGVSAPASAANEAIMQLIEIMHKKGSITNDEYEMLKGAALADDENNEAKADKKDLAKTQKEVDDKMKLLSWAEKIKLTGDMRLRYQAQDGLGLKNPHDRDRGRLRYRLGVIAKPSDQMEVGAGLASGPPSLAGGESDPRSTNQTFNDAFSTKGIGLDYAYIDYKFTDNLSAVGGKFKYPKYLYKATDLMWDDDINPEGVSANYTFKNSLGKTFVNGGIWVINESSASADPWLGYAQLGQKFESGDYFGTLAGTYYRFAELTPANFASIQSFVPDAVGNTSEGKFTVLGLSGELGKKNLYGGFTGKVMFDFVDNTGTATNSDVGYAVGADATKGPWHLRYIYGRLDANAVPDFLPDSDRYNGHTNMAGHEGILEYQVFKYTTLGLDYYHTWNLQGDYRIQNILQADIVVKF